MTSRNPTCHSFRVEDAQNYGVNEAIFLSNIRFWVEKNKKSKKHLHNGRYWTFNSVRAFREQAFPYFSTEQIKTIVKNLELKGILLTGQFNKRKYDKTKWYSINDDCSRDESAHSVDSVQTPSPYFETTRPIPDTKPNLTTLSIRERVRSSSIDGTAQNFQDQDVTISLDSL